MALLPFSARAWRRHGVRLRSVGVAAILLLPLADFAQVAQAAEEAVDFDLNFGVFESLSATQERKVEKTNPVTIVPLTDPVLQRLTPQATSRQAPAPSARAPRRELHGQQHDRRSASALTHLRQARELHATGPRDRARVPALGAPCLRGLHKLLGHRAMEQRLAAAHSTDPIHRRRLPTFLLGAVDQDRL